MDILSREDGTTVVRLQEHDFHQLVNGESVEQSIGTRGKLQIYLTDIGFAVMERCIADAARRPALRRQLEKLDRDRVVTLLEGASIQCYDHETDVELREALLENIIDGTIHEDLIED